MVDDVCMHPWKYYTEPFKIIDGLYYVGNTEVSSYLIDTGDGLILHDTAFPQTGYLLLESIRRLRFDPADIKYIIHSHAHYDHMGGTKAITELTGAKTFLGRDDVPILKLRKDLTWANEYGVEFFESFDVDYELSDNDHIKLGEVDIKCVHIPGHTAGSFSYFFELRNNNVTYRVGTHGGPGLNTLTSDYIRQYGLSLESRKNYLSSMEKLANEKVDIFIGIHPAQSKIFEKKARCFQGRNAFTDSDEWHLFLESMKKAAKSIWYGDVGGDTL